MRGYFVVVRHGAAAKSSSISPTPFFNNNDETYEVPDLREDKTCFRV